MSALIVSEYRKLATPRSTWWALLLAPFTAAVAAGVGVHLAPASDHLVLTQAARGVAEQLWLLVTAIAILASAGEFQHRTVLARHCLPHHAVPQCSAPRRRSSPGTARC
jgi:hypothetical protein